MKALIVGKTKMGSSSACIGAIAIEDKKSLRLLNSNGYNWPADVAFKVGEVWELSLGATAPVIPPHIEDVHVNTYTFIQPHPDSKAFIRGSGLVVGHDVMLAFGVSPNISGSGGCYFREGDRIPEKSTVFITTSTPLAWVDPHYRIPIRHPTLKYVQVKYVGFEKPIATIPAGALVRLSLARWWKPSDAGDDCARMCFLQLSGWFL